MKHLHALSVCDYIRERESGAVLFEFVFCFSMRVCITLPFLVLVGAAFVFFVFFSHYCLESYQYVCLSLSLSLLCLLSVVSVTVYVYVCLHIILSLNYLLLFLFLFDMKSFLYTQTIYLDIDNSIASSECLFCISSPFLLFEKVLIVLMSYHIVVVSYLYICACVLLCIETPHASCSLYLVFCCFPPRTSEKLAPTRSCWMNAFTEIAVR
jgi:hypothetical protein